ncbi:MAG: ComEC/Rec2 family competence protein, partial [bacterium]
MNPLTLLTILFTAGIFLADKIRINPLLPGIVAVVFLTLALTSALTKRRILFELFLCCLTFSIGAFSIKNYYQLPKCHIARYAHYKSSQPYLIKGYVDSPADIKEGRSSFIFQAQQIQLGDASYNCCGKILAYLKTKRKFCYGQELILKGRLSKPPAFGGVSFRGYLYRQGVYAILHADSVSPGIGLKKNYALAAKIFAFWLKDRIESIIFKYLTRLPGSILDAMILGEKKHISPLIYRSMIKSGTVHILVVSGFNVGIVAFIIISILKLARLKRRLRILVAIPLLIIYCLVTGATNPVVRATIMAIVFMLSYFFKSEADIYNSLSLSALFILGLRPAQLFDVGFQLSFASVFSIAYLYPRIKALFRIDTIRIKYLKFLLETGLLSLSTWLG